MLDKSLKLGGLQVGGPRTLQNPARFRIADNVYQTLDDYTVMRFGNKDLFTVPSGMTVVAVGEYKLKPFYIAQDAVGGVEFYYDSTAPIPKSEPFSYPAPPVAGDVFSSGIQFKEQGDCLFFNIPFTGLFKYDGHHVYRAGVPTPMFSCAQYASGGATFVRVIGHKLDFQGNQINSGYLQFPATPSGNNITLRVDKGAVDISTPANTGVSPSDRKDWDTLYNGHDLFFIRPTSSSVSQTVDDFTVTTGGDHYVKVGCWLVFTAQYTTSATNGFAIFDTYATAFKVKSFDGTTVTFHKDPAKYMLSDRQWVDSAVPTAPSIVSGSVISNHFLSIWTSNVATGNYVWKSIFPIAFWSANAQNETINVSSPTVPGAGVSSSAFNLAGNLGDIYDVISVKFPFPSFSEEFSSSSFCTYGELAVISQKFAIYFSDTSKGGSFEMTAALAFVAVGSEGDGPYQAIQGTADFMLVSRQFKNYYLSGNLPTANYRVQPIAQTSLGVYSNEATVTCLDKIIFVNKTGVWALYPGGKCIEASENVRGLFTTFSNTTLYKEEEYWDISNLPTYITLNDYIQGADNSRNKWMRVKFDVCRNLVFIAIAGATKSGSILVLNMNNGELYTWNDILYGESAKDFKDLCAIEGVYYVAGGRKIKKEEKSDVNFKYDYRGGQFPPTLAKTWFTAGEPSLEKKTKQIKLWGKLVGVATISQFTDWSETEEPGGTYANQSDALFSHKKRLNSANVLALSVKVSFQCTKLELEGMELEFEPLQMGMKR
jgi:hypothetical protein